MDETAEQLKAWSETKRLCGLTDAHIQMARELRMKPKLLPSLAGSSPTTVIQHIETLYLGRFKKPRPDAVVPLRKLLQEAEAREQMKKRETRRARRRADQLAADAARAALTSIQRLYGG